MTTASPVIVALDYNKLSDVKAMAEQLSPDYCRVKVGKELFTQCGPAVVELLKTKGFDVFLDLKFHDIPNTVAGAVKAAADLGVWMVNVHASGGMRMMAAAKEALSHCQQPPLLTAVTVLTSMDQRDLREVGIDVEPKEHVLRLATLTKQAGLDGVVCSAQETTMLKERLGADFKLVTPGIRPASDDVGDQRRVATPESAMAMGSHYLVIGRPITQSENPLATLKKINQSLL